MDVELINESSIPTKKIAKVLKLFKLRVIPHLKIYVRDSRRAFYGYFLARDNKIVIGLGDSSNFPTTVYRTKKDREEGYASGFYLQSQEAALVYLLAHELRHGWQWVNEDKERKGRIKDFFSETDTEAYALSKLKVWAKRKHGSYNKKNRHR